MPRTPYPITGIISDIDGTVAGNSVVIIYNLVNGDKMTTNTNSNGVYLVDVANADKEWVSGEKILIRAYYPGTNYRSNEIISSISGSSLSQNLTLRVSRPQHTKEVNEKKIDVLEHNPNANSKNVTIVDASGNIIKGTQLEENRLGSECTGTTGTTGRVLTLQNVNETGNPVSVWIEQQLVSSSDYTVNHLGISSTITFGSIAVYDADGIKVKYYV